MQTPAAHPRSLPLDRLLAECRFDVFRGPGPGGQKRNKTSSAVRVTHEPTGLSAIAMESRSQHQNRAKAIERLRLRLAAELRQPIDLTTFLPAQLLDGLLVHGRLRLSPRHDRYLEIAGTLLDVLAACDGSVSVAADKLGLTTANLVDFLQRDEKLLDQANRLRIEHGLRKLGGM